ncbi:unnamed protein product [Soboliphyme baturini]|uniref:3'(2'),5'-bisphosphate nucleotidase n=1 Tax=Soboliphyme baturini TaxID=241478 RepID=A0A183IPW4_9BILA|nr:unnamed protein product [Soboliphyme baturini]
MIMPHRPTHLDQHRELTLLGKDCEAAASSSRNEQFSLNFIDGYHHARVPLVLGILQNATILIGLALKGRPIAGVIHQPFWNRTVWGLEGVGTIGVDVHPLRGRKVIATTRSHGNELMTETLQAMNADEVLKVGGAGYKVLLLLEGKASAYVFASKGCNKWDTCAPEAVLRAAGTFILKNIYSCNDVRYSLSFSFATGPSKSLFSSTNYISEIV